MANNMFKSLGRTVSKHTPELLTAFGIANMCAGVVFAVKSTPKAMDILKKAEQEKGEKLTKTEVIEKAWKIYIPTTAFCMAAAACFIGSTTVSGNRYAALSAAYSLSDAAFRDYKDEVKEIVGEQKEQEIHTKTVQKKIDSSPVPEKIPSAFGTAVLPESEQTLCYDTFAGRYFFSDRSSIDKALNELNRLLINEDFASLNDFYDLVGLERTKIGDLLGWNDISGRGAPKARYSSHLSPNGRPSLAVSFDIAPKYGSY